MRIIADMHTHTIVSGHAYSTLQENLKVAKERGLEFMATTEHGPAMPNAPHKYYFSNMRVLPREVGGVRLIRGAEANIISAEGKLDLSDRFLKQLEYVAIGLHRDCIAPGTEEENTRTVLAAIANPYVDAIVHPGNPAFPINFLKVLLAASAAGVLIEINNSSLVSSRAGSTKRCHEVACLAAQHKVNVVLGSDAHWSDQVGLLDKAYALATEAGILPENILNLDATQVENFIEQRQLRKQQ